MDFQRSHLQRGVWGIRLAFGLAIAIGIVAVNLGISRFFPNTPSIDSRTIVIGTVQRGEFTHEVRCVGQLVSEENTMRSAKTKASVARIAALPGTRVTPGTLLLELTNPELEMAKNDAASNLGVAEAELITQKAKLDNELLQLEAAWQRLEADHEQAAANYKVSLELRDKNENAVSLQQLKSEELAAASLLKQRDLALKAYERFGQSIGDHLAINEERISQAKTNLQRETARQESLQVYAGVDGVLAQVPVTVGQQLEAGELLAKIVNPHKLKAELRVAEVEARYIREGQPAKVDTHHGVITGKVTRLDPEVVLGSVTIDVSFGTTKLPREVRPDLSITGLVEVDRMQDVLWVNRPASAKAASKGTIFRCVADGLAVRTDVEYGIASASAIVVQSGLRAGERIILSDMSRFEEATEVRLD